MLLCIQHLSALFISPIFEHERVSGWILNSYSKIYKTERTIITFLILFIPILFGVFSSYSKLEVEQKETIKREIQQKLDEQKRHELAEKLRSYKRPDIAEEEQKNKKGDEPSQKLDEEKRKEEAKKKLEEKFEELYKKYGVDNEASPKNEPG